VSLPPVIYRDIGEEVPASDRIIYEAFIDALERPSRTTPERAVLRARQRCGVNRQLVLDVIRSINVEALPTYLWFDDLDSNPRVP
jgi:hypothetical protein